MACTAEKKLELYRKSTIKHVSAIANKLKKLEKDLPVNNTPDEDRLCAMVRTALRDIKKDVDKLL